MNRGRERRLRKRFVQFDHARNRAAWTFGAIVCVPAVLIVVVLHIVRANVPLSDSAVVVLLFGTWIGSFLIAVVWIRRRCNALADEYDLICSRCDAPLARADLFRRSARSPAYRRPFEIPARCPSCGAPIEEAARPAGDG